MGEVGFSRVPDQVVRLQQLRADHPHLEITHSRSPEWRYTCVWYSGGLRREVTAGELRDLIDLVREALTESPR